MLKNKNGDEIKPVAVEIPNVGEEYYENVPAQMMHWENWSTLQKKDWQPPQNTNQLKVSMSW
jgi:hypothetical protein